MNDNRWVMRFVFKWCVKLYNDNYIEQFIRKIWLANLRNQVFQNAFLIQLLHKSTKILEVQNNIQESVYTLKIECISIELIAVKLVSLL